MPDEDANTPTRPLPTMRRSPGRHTPLGPLGATAAGSLLAGFLLAALCSAYGRAPRIPPPARAVAWVCACGLLVIGLLCAAACALLALEALLAHASAASAERRRAPYVRAASRRAEERQHLREVAEAAADSEPGTVAPVTWLRPPEAARTRGRRGATG